jgi:cathepsin F
LIHKMRSAILVVLALCVFALCDAKRVNRDEALFAKFMKQYGKTYATTEEHNQRFTNFKANLRKNAELNRKQPKASFGINKFSDMTQDEFRQHMLLPKFDPQQDNTCLWPYHRVAKVNSQAIPSTWDWRQKGAVSPVKNQASCGSCWAFSTAENVEGQWFLSKGKLLSLSEQWIVDCSHGCLQSEPDLCNGGCGGGLPWLAYQDIMTNTGLTDEADYPYTGEDGTCQTGKPIMAKIGNWTALSTDVTQIMTYLVSNGPLSITLNADLLFSYSGGIITGSPDDCPNSGSDHAVLLVGYDQTQDFWLVKNSWGADWGESGYFRIEYDNGLCGINSCVTSATM